MVLGPAWNGASISACRLADPVGYFTAYPLSRDHSGLSRAMGHVFNGREYRYLLPYWFFPCSAVAGLAVVEIRSALLFLLNLSSFSLGAVAMWMM